MIYRFGHFEIDVSRRELRRDDQRVETEPKVFDLLCYLLEHRDRAVSKDEILESVWPNQIVSDTALSRAVMKVRRSVGDDSSAQSVIRTLHGHGYRFIAAVDVVDRDASTPAAALRPAPAAAPPPRRRWHLAAVAAVLVVAVIAGFVLLSDLDPDIAIPEGSLAVLPVYNAAAEADGGWVRLGLMSLMNRMLEDDGVDVVPDRLVSSVIGDADFATPPDREAFERIRQQVGADAVLHTTLDLGGGLYRLGATLTHPDGTRSRRVIVGEAPAAIAADMAGVIAGLVRREHVDPSARFALVSTDPFVNELYARALDLELQGEIAEAREMFRLAATQEPELFWLRYEIALCTRDLTEYEEADLMFRELLAEARGGGDARALVATLNSHGQQKLKQRQYTEAETLLQQALTAAGERALANERATINVNLALVDSWQGNDPAAAGHYAAALDAYAESGLDPSPWFLNNYAGLLHRLGRSDEALVYAEQAVEGFRLRGQRRFEAPSLNRLAKIQRTLGDPATALDTHNQARAIYAELGDSTGELSAMSAMTTVFRESGDLTRARLNAREVLERSLALPDDPYSVADGYIQLAYVEADDHRHDVAIGLFEQAAAIFGSINDKRAVRAARIGLARSAIALGDSERARRIGERMLAEAGEDESARARGLWVLGLAELADGDYAAAREHLGLALDHARLSQDTRMLARAGAGLAEVSLHDGALERAREYLEEVRPYAGSDHDFERLDARVARAEGHDERALAILTTLRSAAGEGWSENDEALLAELRRD